MTGKGSLSARETYEAYRRGEITAEQAEKRAKDWYASRREAPPKPPKKA